MDDHNYIDITETMRSRPIYRIMSIDRLLELFDHRQNVLVKPKNWQDPFENFILRSRVRLKTGQLAQFSYHDQFYGQCWTLQSASDAMWRIYSPDRNAIRIRSTIRTVAESLSKSLGDYAQIQAFIGKVQYLSNKRLSEFASNWFPGTPKLGAKISAQTLLVKRPAFKHEREIRLLYFQHDPANTIGDLHWYSVNPHEFIDQIMIDPRMSEAEAVALKERIQRRTGFRGRILRSLLYAPPPDLIVQESDAPNHPSRRSLAGERR
ncbi:MAG: DUF2971 domain-containing protein [Proteobacteria bacterium]|nr:DUF2971 domain-containing protein [Pseudomonadota bacterium]